jgi:RNA polymerase sigma-70 factor (ECF subfamily)
LSYIESDIIPQIAQGNKSAFETLFKSHYANLCGYAVKYVWELEQAEEIVQDLFFNIWNKRSDLYISSSIESYLFRAVRNACLNYLKHRKIRDNYASSVQEVHNPGLGQVDDPVETLELQKKIDESIESMPPERKKIFLLSRHEGLKYKEIAEQLGISVKTVEAQMGKALKFLREELKEFIVILIYIIVEIILFFYR